MCLNIIHVSTMYSRPMGDVLDVVDGCKEDQEQIKKNNCSSWLMFLVSWPGVACSIAWL